MLKCWHRCGGAGHLRDDIFDYMIRLDEFTNIEDERRDMGINALRFVAFWTYLIYVECLHDTHKYTYRCMRLQCVFSELRLFIFLENGKLRVSTSNLMVDCRKSYVEYEAG